VVVELNLVQLVSVELHIIGELGIPGPGVDLHIIVH